MARNLAGAVMAVRAWNRTREKAEPLARAAEGTDFLITMLSDAFGYSVNIKSWFMSKKTTAPSSNSVPMIPRVGNPIPSR